MPQISEMEFLGLPLRAHQLLAGVPLHDVRAVDLPGPRTGITIDQFLRAANDQLFTPSPQALSISLSIQARVWRSPF
jgi:hypothetical protein